jgi:hypothetical protein
MADDGWHRTDVTRVEPRVAGEADGRGELSPVTVESVDPADRAWADDAGVVVKDAIVAGQRKGRRARMEPGRTALLDYLVEHSSGCRVERRAGVESETELAFAGLH